MQCDDSTQAIALCEAFVIAAMSTLREEIPMRMRQFGRAGLVTIASLALIPAAAAAFTQDQAEAGKDAFDAHCAACHGFRAEGGEAPALSGIDVMGNFATGAGLYDFFSQAMPPQAPGLLGEDTYLDILARLLVLNGAEPDGEPLTADPEALEAVSLAGLGVNVGSAARAAAPDAPGMGTNVPQAFTWGQPLPAAGGGTTGAATATSAATTGVPQAFTFGKELPQAN